MDTISATILLILLMDPLGNMPFFVSALSSVSPARRMRVLIRELLLALLIMLTFLFFGQAFCRLLHLQQESLLIAGAIMLFIMAIKMIFPPSSKEKDEEECTKDEPFIVPLAIPLIAGPAVLATLMLLTNSEHGAFIHWLVALLLSWLTTSLILLASPFISKILKKRGSIAMERFSGIILVIISVQMFLDGFKNYLHP